MKECKQCQSSFEVFPEDRAFLDKVSPVFGGKKYVIPDPALCPRCRRQRRLAWRNERVMYHRKCDMSGKQIISMYPPDAPFPVYHSESWYGDSWDPRDYGQDFDFNRPFFEQFAELQNKVPRLALISKNNENADYCNIVGDSKNCYLIYGSVHCEDCYYGNPYFSKDCIDSLVVRSSDHCYECVDCEELYECFYCQNCARSRNLYMCYDVENSSDCFMCVGLRKKSYCIFNEQYSRREYEAKMKEIRFGGHQVFRHLWKKFNEIKLKYPRRFQIGLNNENVTGDQIYNSKNCRELFYGDECEDVAYSAQLLKSKDCMDCEPGEIGESLYEIGGFYELNYSLFSHWCWGNCSSLLYCSKSTLGSKDCFGSISLKKNQYCILNKQYTKEAYMRLVPKIIGHMKETGEWGEFFPVSISTFAYNETIANDYFPLSREETLARNWSWREDSEEKSYKGPKVELPDNIEEAKDDITSQILLCEVSGKPYKIIPQELAFCRKHKLPLPRKCPDQRHKERMALRNPSGLWERKCEKCGVGIKTTYAPDRPEKVYCEQCYLKEVY